MAYEDSKLNDWTKQAENPAAPYGQQQAARAAQGYENGEARYADSSLGKWTSQSGYQGTASSWWNGQNLEGTNNGWDNGFTQKFMDGQKQAMEQKRFATYFTNAEENKSTGVATWDHQSDDGRTNVKFGDVYEDGKKVSNLYEDYDKPTADMMMSAWMFDGKQMSRILGASDRQDRLGREVEAARESNNINIPKQLTAAEFQGTVEEREKLIEAGMWDEAAVGAAGVGAGVLTAAGAGFLGAGPVGAAVAGVGAGVVGLVGAALNKDEITEQAARAYEITALAERENGTAPAIVTGIKEWAGFSTNLTSPITQAVHGAKELADGGVGDGNSAFYGVDDAGNSTTGTGWKVLGLGAAVADGALQFMSPIARGVYTTQMGGAVAGGAGELIVTGGETFNPRSGQMDNIFVDDKGNFDPVSGAAGVLKVGIDAVQLGGWRGLAAATGSRSAAAAAGKDITEVAGFRYTLDAAGNATGRKATMSLLAPSEQISNISAARAARVKAMTEGRAVSADDYYQAAMRLANGDNRLKTALVNGFGEGYEEVAQEILEPISMDGRLEFGDIANAFFYGAAGGLGMSLGATANALTPDARMQARAEVLYSIRTDGSAMPEGMWSSMSNIDKRIAASATPADAVLTRDAMRSMAKEQTAGMVASEVDAAKAIDARRAAVDQDLAKATENTDAYTVISGVLDANRDVRPESIHASASKIYNLLDERLKGIRLQQEFLESRLADPAVQGNEQLLAETGELVQQAQAMRLTGNEIVATYEATLDRLFVRGDSAYEAALTAEEAQELISRLNQYMEDAFDQKFQMDLSATDLTPEQATRAAAQFISLLSSREPKLDAGSFPALLPRIDWMMTSQGTNNFVQINLDLLQSTNGDFDGDKFRAENQVILNDRRFAQVRAGQTLGGASVNKKGQPVVDITEAHNFDEAMASAVGAGIRSSNDVLQSSANQALANIESALIERYGDLMTAERMQSVIDGFRADVDGGVAESRTNLINALYKAADVNGVGLETLVNEPLWISNLVRAEFQSFQRSYYLERQSLADERTPTAEVGGELTPQGVNQRKRAAATDAQTLAIFAVGNTLFRKFQKIHYSWYNSRALRAAGAERSDLLEQAQALEELSKGITRSELQLATNDNSVEARVLVMLRRLVDSALADPDIGSSLNPATSMSVLANVKVKDVYFEGGVPVTDPNNKDLSLLQLLLKRALDAETEELSKVLAVDEKLRSRFAALRALTVSNDVDGGMNAEKAFIKVFGATQFGDIMGRSTGSLAANITPEQWLRTYTAANDVVQGQMERQLKDAPEYLSRKEKTNLPYSLNEAERGEVTPYRSMVDSLLAVGRGRLTFNPGTVEAKRNPMEAFGGELARPSKAAATAFLENFDIVSKATDDFRTLTNQHVGQDKRKSRAALVQEMFAMNPGYGRQALDMIPDAAANGLYDVRNEELFVSNWVYDMYALENRDEALMFYWRNLHLAKWNSTLASLKEHDDAGAPGRAYSKIESRFQRLLYSLAQQPGQRLFELVMREMANAKNVDEFFVWLNQHPGIRGDQAVLLPFNDDVSSFEPDATGWTTSRPSVELQQAIKAARSSAPMLMDNMRFLAESDANDRAMLASINRAFTNDAKATPEDDQNLRRFKETLATSMVLPRGFAPSSMLEMIRGAVRGFDSGSYDKGKTPTTWEGFGAFQANMDGFGFLPSLERMMEAVTAHSIDSLGTNVGDLGKYDGEAMDVNGRPIELQRLDVETALEMLQDYRTKPLALAMLTPSAMEATHGKLSERLLFDASLTDLLKGNGFSALFKTDDKGNRAFSTAASYLSMVESVSRNYGAPFEPFRMAIDLAISRTSTLTRRASPEDYQQFMEDAVMDVADILQTVGALQSSPDNTSAGVLEALRDTTVKELRDRARSRALPGLSDAQGKVMDVWVENLSLTLQLELDEAILRATEQYSGAELDRAREALTRQHEENLARITGLMDDDPSATVVSRFHVTATKDTDPAQADITDAAARAQITSFVRSMANAASRMPEAAPALTQLNEQVDRGEQPVLSAEDWDTLARGAMGVTLADQVVAMASHVSVPPFPKGDPLESDSRFYKYFDHSFSYLAMDLLNPESPATAAAVWINQRANNPIGLVKLDKVSSKINRSLLNPKRLGTWTPALMSQIVEAQQRMDSSGAPSAIALSGNIPKRWAAIVFASQRTDENAGLEALTTTLPINGSLLNAASHPYNTVTVTPAGASAPRQMPIAQLNNRFFSAVRFNGEDIPLTYENMGFEWDGTSTPTNLRYIALDRLQTALDRWASSQGLGPDEVEVELDFLHPDSQPAGWMHNAYFEGMSHTIMPDGAESLIATGWSDNGGLTAKLTQFALDAGKKGMMSLRPFRAPDKLKLEQAKNAWLIDEDMAEMLRRKTEILMLDEQSGETLSPTLYNWAYKIMKMQHMVAATAGEARQVFTADEVIASQLAGVPLEIDGVPIDSAKLLVLSTDVLRTMVGETGTQGVNRFLDFEYELNPDLIQPFTGMTPAILRRFEDGWFSENGTIADTSLVNLGQQRVVKVKSMLSNTERNQRADRITYLSQVKADVQAKRALKLDAAAERRNFLSVLQLAQGLVGTESYSFEFAAMNAGVIGPKEILDTQHSDRLLQTAAGGVVEGGFERAWRIKDEGGPNYVGGVLTVDNLKANDDPIHKVIMGDWALVELNTFQRPERDMDQVTARLEKALSFLVDNGATVILGSGDARGDIRYEAADFMLQRGYAPLPGSKHVYAPVEQLSWSQNQKAYESTLHETGTTAPANNVVLFLATDPVGADENLLILNPESRKMRDRVVMNNILPSSGYSNYNVPREDNKDQGLYVRALSQLRTKLDPSNDEARATLLEMGGPDPARTKPLEQALNDFHQKITTRSSLAPAVGDVLEVGDIVPFVNSQGSIILYRHGFKRPRPQDVAALQRTGDLGVALAKSETDPGATANSGTVRSIDPRAGFGDTLVLETALQPVGDKIQMSWTGMKYTTVNPGADTFFPDMVFGNGTVLDGISDIASARSKEATKGFIDNYRTALAFFNFDFTDDMVKFFFPGQPVTAENRILTYNLLERLSTQTDFRLPTLAAADLARTAGRVAEMLSPFAQQMEATEQIPQDWAARLIDQDTATSQIAQSVILYLMTPGAVLDNVLRSAGFSHPEANDPAMLTREVPGLFADLLDRGMDTPLHKELIRRFDSQLYTGANGSGLVLLPNWTVEMHGERDSDGNTPKIQGLLQYGEGISSGDNPELDGQAFDITESRAVSPHNAAAAAQSIGGTSVTKALKRSKLFAKSFSRGSGVKKFSETPGEGDSMWEMLSDVPVVSDDNYVGTRHETHLETGRRSAARDETLGLYNELNTTAAEWTAEDGRKLKDYEQTSKQILEALNLYGRDRGVVDTWVRQHAGRPYGLDIDGIERGVISADDVNQFARNILSNVRRGLMPVAGANIPLMDINHLTAIYTANSNLPESSAWSPFTTTDRTGQRASGWDSWVETAFGTAWPTDKDLKFEQMYLLAVDGLMHGYQGATSALRDLPVSSDLLRAQGLLAEEGNALFVSISADENLLATDPVLFNTQRAGLDEIITGQRIYADVRGEPDPSSAMGRQKKRIERWYAEQDRPQPTEKRVRGIRAAGATFVGHSTKTSALFRSAVNLRAGNALFNSALVVMAPFEALYRRQIDMGANVLSGEAIGAVGRAQARFSEWVKDTSMGGIAEALGLETRYTVDELELADKIVTALSGLSEFKSVVYKELMFQYPSMPGIGRIEKALERYAKLGGRLQDPAWGMLPRDLAKIYVSTAMRHIKANPTGENVYSIETMLTQLTRNPDWLKTNDLEAHNMAINAISQVRSMKSTVLSLTMRGVIEPMSQNPKVVVNAAGNFLKLLTLFQNFFANAATTMTGLQGAADFAAFMVDGREKKLGRRIQAAIGGKEYDLKAQDHYDMSEVLESMDLADSFIRGGVTHSGLFLLGLTAGGLGLSGEDDEQKYRRRQAELQGGAFVQDPRRLEADIANRDAIFLDWLPGSFGDMFKVPDAAGGTSKVMQMNFMTRTFLSPIIGMERFFNNGDFSEILLGYKDALGSHPLVNDQLWNAAAETAATLQTQAALAAQDEGVGAQAQAAGLLMTSVGVLERMLFENAAVNMVYVGTDEYDRDPGKLPALDSDGNPQVDVKGNRYATSALRDFTNEDGDTQQGYVERGQGGTDYRTLSESRFGLALAGTIWNGITGKGFTGSDFMRQNMVVKTRSVEIPPMDPTEMRANFLAAFQGEGGMANLNEEEALNILRNQGVGGKYARNSELEPLAKQYADQAGPALGNLTSATQAQLGNTEAAELFGGLLTGQLKLDDPRLNGTFISWDDRVALQEEWMKDIVAEGVAMGLDHTKANSRMKRIWFGPYDDKEAVGMRDIVFSELIPITDKVEYNQLNTGYVPGIDGYPRATGFTRDGLMGALGLKLGNRAWGPEDTGLDMDARLNTVDGPLGINTGMRALERRGEGWKIPTVEEQIEKAAEKVADAIAGMTFPQQNGYGSSSGGGGGGGYRRGGGGGGYSGYSGGGSSYFTRMNSFPDQRAPYGDGIPFINTSNPILRRSDIRRERVWSERGRLKQWQ